MPLLAQTIYLLFSVLININGLPVEHAYTTINGLFSSEVQASTIPPTTTHTITPATPDGNNNWYVSPVTIRLDATDLESGVKTINYRINGGTWNVVDFSGTTNLVLNPSFETVGGTNTGAANWVGAPVDPEGTYSRTNAEYAPSFSSNSGKIVATGGTWHGINNQGAYSAALPYDNMSASVYMKTEDVTGSAKYVVYAVSPDGLGGYTYTYLDESAPLTGTNGWTQVNLDFTVNVADAVGVYIDVGLAGPGTVWADAVTLTTSLNSTSTEFTIATDNIAYTIEYYSEDFAGNIEAYGCPTTNCITFKLDQIPPGNWQNSGAIRQIGGGPSAEHELWVFTDVSDATSGLSTNSNEYQYFTSTQPDFGYYSNLLGCNSTWNSDQWVALQDPVTTDGDATATLQTQKTDFCDSNWKICKDVRFYAEDMAGNAVTKDICLNGPWVQVQGEGYVRANSHIDMVSESSDDNTDGLIEAGGFSIDFFTSSKGWEVLNSPTPFTTSYAEMDSQVIGSRTTITNGKLVSSSGVYQVNGDLNLATNDIPNNYDTEVFNQIVFVDGDLTIGGNIVISDSSTALYIVNGDVFIDESVEDLYAAIIAEGDIYTAYDLAVGQSTKTLNLHGFYVADEILLQRTLQGTQNNATPSEAFVFEPKYIIQLRDYFGESTVVWFP